MRKSLLLIPFILFVLISCATTPSTLMPQRFPSNSERGVIVGTIAIENEKPIFNQYFFHYVNIKDFRIGINKMITVRPEQTIKMKFKPDFVDDTKAVYYFSIIQNPGDYEFTVLRLHANGGFIQSEAHVAMEIPFKVEKGKVKYLGEIYFNYNQGILQLVDKKERDIKKFNEKYPNLTIEY